MISPIIDNKVLVTSGLVVQNPPDLVSTWDRIRVYASAASSESDYTLSACTASIVTANTTVDSPGYTELTWSNTNGIDSSFWFKASYYHSTAANPVSNQSSRTLLATKTRLEDQIALKLRDTANAVWSSDEIRECAERAVQALYPTIFMKAKDSTSLDTVKNQREYTLPGGWFKVNRVYFGDPGEDYTEVSNYTIVGNRTLVFSFDPQTADDITIYGHKKFQHSWEVPLVYEDVMLYYALYLAYQALETDRAKFKQYAALVKDKDVRVGEVVAIANTYLGRYKDRLEDLAEWSPTERALV